MGLVQETPVVPDRDGARPDRGLDRLIRITAVVLVLAVAGFVAFYLLDQRVDAGPSLVDRQIEAAEQVVANSPNALGPRLQLAEAYRVAERYDDALAQYDEVLKAQDNHRTALLGRAKVLIATGHTDEAVLSLQRITEGSVDGEFAGADPQLEEAFYDLGSIALDKGDWAAAIKQLTLALKIEPTDSDAWYVLGRAQLAAASPKDAVESLRKALLFVPMGWCEPYVSLTEAYQKLSLGPQAEYAMAMTDLCQKKPDDARRRLQGLVGGPVSTDAMLGLGMVAEQQSQREEAVGWYRKVLAKDGANIAAITALSRLGVGPTTNVGAVEAPAAGGTGKASLPAGHPDTGVSAANSTKGS